ncbi:MAG: M23 family metallopeptidase [Candidatus Thiodiazotropha sp. (ex Semelilucina semeliformis)]|nr:M23 family metallopeptidase [Candidatus Thiodiazotropha sp. (ex Myrtea spinifera)]MCU7806726.1 M23 family metallopeptidase [Candidatus Thiodiazotropha sp. (ex Semelilucina semeliformis)]MCU7827849.1 M23 family metallopeptidase [Candidatus Thiodiazotropha sp. (ex Myrtea sp. 'scaly one' KF741663)]
MKIIYLRGIGQTCSRAMRCFYASVIAAVVGVFGLGMLWAGYQMGIESAEFPEHQLVASLKRTFADERQLLSDVKADAQNEIDALAIRMGQLQSQLIRLDALGERLVEIGRLDKGEFSFQEPPAIGGPEGQDAVADQSALPDLLQEMQSLEEMIDDRQQQLTLVEDLIMNSNLEESIHPAGRPIKKGWISSYFGMRNDPFSGKRAMHKGMDFAGKEGSDVVAVAAGVVTWSGDRYGYGELVEINHGKGYVTRYGHNAKILVEIGDRIRPGQVIATMGSTGRSTGPHVHFEVVRNGKIVNPTKYIRTKRSKDSA